MFVTLDENGYVENFAIVGEIDNAIEVDEPENLDDFLQHPAAYRYVNNQLVTTQQEIEVADRNILIEELRGRRQRECYTYINRGELWYNHLTDYQKEELNAWYQAWLDVTETLEVPEKPSWLE